MVQAFVVVLMLVAVEPAETSAVTIDLTGGSVRMFRTTPTPFDDVFVSLSGEQFSLTNDFLRSSFIWTAGSGAPPFILPLVGAPLDFSGRINFGVPTDLLVFQGVEYLAVGTLHLSVPTVAAALAVSSPFSLTGSLLGRRPGEPDVEFSIIGVGTMEARFLPVGGGRLTLDAVTYSIEPVPEPSTWLLIATGLAALGFVLRNRRSARS
jgi:hypothetical protein